MSIRLEAVKTEAPNTVELRMLFPVPDGAEAAACAVATLDTGDGRIRELGVICAPTAETWPERHTRALTTHTYARGGRYVAFVTWGECVAATVVDAGDDDPSPSDAFPALIYFNVSENSGEPLTVDVELDLSEPLAWHRVRVDGGAQNVHVLSPGDDSHAAGHLSAVWRFSYQKPGPYRVYIDLIDPEGFWMARLGVFPFEVSDPIHDPDTARRPRPPDELPDSDRRSVPQDIVDINESLPPWMPFRYMMPLWASARTYTQPGGSLVSRVLTLGTYLAVRTAVEVDGADWYQTSNNDWIPASSVTELAPSELRGVDLDEAAPPSPYPSARSAVYSGGTQDGVDAFRLPDAPGGPGARLPVGWVTSQALNVRARPGVAADNPPIAQLAHNQLLEITGVEYVAGYRWYRIGEERWVYGGSVGEARVRRRPSSIGADELWVGVNLVEQTLVAYEGDRPVYAALVATGLPGTPTVAGVFRTWWRLDWRKMSGGSPASRGYYYLEAVPWTCYFYSGYALHGAYWHDGFGRPRSHGCVNLSLYDSWWIYEWSTRGGANSPAVYVYRE